ncbi:MAG: 1-acyl-sn-glycerol-3-phosphate acyltransferase [Corallococcus sp.]|nr:1-acyl-sn-glycerol-3-phosphate acyltransferase [Bacillota bacterium]MCM1533452.1 1-acyl-sn-glycerol-3-phosphate acyltransferase [Corallococcus sp.]
MSQNKWVKRRHKGIFAFFRGIFRIHTKIKYNFTAEKSSLKGPFLLLCNHVTTFDPVFAALSFKCPIYFCAMDDLFNMKVVSPILRYMVAPIPKKKSSTDTTAIRSCLRVLREGGAVGVFPEGNRILSGSQWPMEDALAKFVKISKVPLVVYNIEGGYGSDPRWGVSKRKGKMYGRIRLVLQPDEYKSMPIDELFKLICDSLRVDDMTSGVKFKSNKRAENIERVLYMCPHCSAVSSIRSKGNKFRCTACGKEWEYTEDLHIVPNDKFSVISEWHDWEQNEIIRLALSQNTDVFDDKNIELYDSIRFKKKQRISGDRITANAERFRIYGEDGIKEFPISEIDGIALVRRNRFDFYHKGVTYQVRGDERFCSVKYVHLCEGIKKASRQD